MTQIQVELDSDGMIGVKKNDIYIFTGFGFQFSKIEATHVLLFHKEGREPFNKVALIWF